MLINSVYSFIIDGQGAAYVAQLAFQFACYFVGIVFLYAVTVLWVTDTNYFIEDNVIVPEHVKDDAQIQGKVTEDDIEREHQKEAEAEGKANSVVAAEAGSSSHR